MKRRIIVLTNGPPTIHKLDDKLKDPTIWVYLTSDDRIQAVAYSNTPFYSTHGRKAEYVCKNPDVYQVANFRNETGVVERDYWPFIRELIARNKAELDWSGAKVALEKIAVTA